MHISHGPQLTMDRWPWLLCSWVDQSIYLPPVPTTNSRANSSGVDRRYEKRFARVHPTGYMFCCANEQGPLQGRSYLIVTLPATLFAWGKRKTEERLMLTNTWNCRFLCTRPTLCTSCNTYTCRLLHILARPMVGVLTCRRNT